MKIFKQLFLSVLVLATLLGSSSVSAIPAIPKPVVVTQSDGSKITIRLHGDEFFSYATTIDGYTLVYDESGDYCYAVESNNKLVSSGVRASEVGRRNSKELATIKKLRKGLVDNFAKNRANSIRQEVGARRIKNLKSSPNVVATTENETIKCLVVLVNFQDIEMEYTPADFDLLLNQENYNVDGAFGSVRDYYKDNSNGRLTVDYSVAGPYKLKRDRSFYGRNIFGEDSNPQEMAREAFIHAANDASVNISQYANDEGELEHLFIIYAGEGEADGGDPDSVWPHEWTLERPYTVNGTTAYTYACSSELKYPELTITSIGVICHEFGHVLGYPDFYDTDYSTGGQAFGLDVFSLMDFGGYLYGGMRPAALTSYERYMKGWLDFTEITESGTYILEPVYKDKSYLIKTPTKNEVYIFENRNGKLSKWDAFLDEGDEDLDVRGTGSGLIVYHVDRSNNNVGGTAASTRWMINSINDYEAHQCMMLVMAENISRNPNTLLLSGKIGKVFFPGDEKKASFTSTGNPAFLSWANKSTGFDIYSITQDGENIVLKVTESANYPVISVINVSKEDITISWKSGLAGEWKVEWKEKGSDVVDSKKISEKTIRIENINQSSEYVITVSSEEFPEIKSSATVKTTTIPSMDIKASYKESEIVMLKLKNLKNTPKSIEWRVNGSVTEKLVLSLTKGEYMIEATATHADDTVEYFKRYIKVE